MTPPDPETLADEATEVLQRLIRFNTVNPPGNERAAQEYLAGRLGEAGFTTHLLGATTERPNLVGELSSENPGPTLLLLSHVDTVLATPEDWDHDPWSGDIADGCIWGRGALDMKSQTAAEVVAAAALARGGWRPARGRLLVAVVADEETGGSQGAEWITANHPDLVRCDMLINEGGGGVFMDGSRRLLSLGCAEKGVYRFKVVTSGVAGHASMPRLGDNALLKMAPLIAAMKDRQPGFDLTEEPRGLLTAIGENPDSDLRATLDRLMQTSPLMAFMLEPMLGVTLAPTKISASEKINVIPARAELAVDCRVPPGLSLEEVEGRIHEVLGGEGYEIEFTEVVPGNRSPADSELTGLIREWVAVNDPEAVCVPTVLPGFTDSRTFRAAFPECQAYGFFPHKHTTYMETAPLIHSANERIDVRDLAYATGFFADLVGRVLG